MTIGPRLRALYLIVVAVGVFFIPWWQAVAAVALVQVALWLFLGLGFGPLRMQLRKLILFCGGILIAYSLVGEDPATLATPSISISTVPWLG